MNAEQKALTARRLKSIEGHVRGIARMAEDDAYCIDLIHQIRAVQAALEKVAELTLENHLHSCLVTAVRGDDPDERERVLSEVLDVFQAAPARTTVRSRALQRVKTTGGIP